MTTVVVYKTDTKEVLAAIPMDGGDAVCRNDVEFQIYNGTEPIFTETPVRDIPNSPVKQIYDKDGGQQQ